MNNRTLDRLTFGRSKPNGGVVTDKDWTRFELATVARIFPGGFTIHNVTGGWRDEATGKTITEPAIILDILHDGSEQSQAAVQYIAQMYKATFNQDAVMRMTVPAQVEFI